MEKKKKKTEKSRACLALPFEISNQAIRPTKSVLDTSSSDPLVVIYRRKCPIVAHAALSAVGVLAAYGCPRFLPVGSEA